VVQYGDQPPAPGAFGRGSGGEAPEQLPPDPPAEPGLHLGKSSERRERLHSYDDAGRAQVLLHEPDRSNSLPRLQHELPEELGQVPLDFRLADPARQSQECGGIGLDCLGDGPAGLFQRISRPHGQDRIGVAQRLDELPGPTRLAQDGGGRGVRRADRPPVGTGEQQGEVNPA
jgi:hypothetical protein